MIDEDLVKALKYNFPENSEVVDAAERIKELKGKIDIAKELVKKLEEGCIYHKKRWSGDTHSDLGGTVDEEKTDELMMEAAKRIRDLGQ